MARPLSTFGEKLCAHSGILELMDDLGQAMTTHPQMRMMGGGNPAAIPAVQELWRERLRDLIDNDPDMLDRMLLNYDPPQGNPEFLEALATCLNKALGWQLTAKNVAITAGGQTALFFLFNIFAGPSKNDSRPGKVLLPLVPEYIGYANQGIAEDMFVACPPRIEELDDHDFKYHVDFDAVEAAMQSQSIAAICASRPTNPTGNVLTDEEVARLSELAQKNGIPLILDNAYGAPFPNVLFVDTNPVWDEHIVLTMSLSKLGLPGTRTGIVVANEQIIRQLASLTAVTGLANNNIGQRLVLPMVRNGEILKLSSEVIQPYYRQKSDTARALLSAALGEDIPWRVHVREGAFFLWLWLPGLKISSKELYQKLKQRNVLVVPGEYFFFGLDAAMNHWPHRHECLRITFSQPQQVVEEGLQIIGEELRQLN
ncbi:MAG: valine--pyruvate aminotransferase [Verrucomicrobiales bacterium]|jgi:valine--pyruvate aminotransferase